MVWIQKVESKQIFFLIFYYVNADSEIIYTNYSEMNKNNHQLQNQRKVHEIQGDIQNSEHFKIKE